MSFSSNQNIQIASWNSNGLTNKLHDDYFCRVVNSYDCIVLSETWLSKELGLNEIDNFVTYSEVGPKAPGGRRRHSVLTK